MFPVHLFYIINLTVVFFRAMMCSLEDFEKKLNEVRSGYSRIIKLQFVDLSIVLISRKVITMFNVTLHFSSNLLSELLFNCLTLTIPCYNKGMCVT